MALRWGIASSGRISSDFATALSVLPKTEHQVIAIAARSLSSAEKFAKTHNIPKFYEGYKNLAKDPQVEVVYIGTLNPQHFEVVKLMLENGKNVLCDKPFTMNEKQARTLIELARSKKLFVMEGIWSRCFPVYREVKELVDSGAIGEVKYVSVTFGISKADDDRLKLKELGGGTILDMGIYCLQFQQYIFRGLTPEKVVAAGHLNEEGVDVSVSAILTYPGSKTATFTTNVTADMPNEGLIIGTTGLIKIPLIWCPTTYELNGKIKEIPLIKNDGHFNYEINSAGLAYEAEEVRQQIRSGKIESDKITHDETIQLANWMDTLRREVGEVFPADFE